MNLHSFFGLHFALHCNYNKYERIGRNCIDILINSKIFHFPIFGTIFAIDSAYKHQKKISQEILDMALLTYTNYTQAPTAN